ncbi:MAG: hypothetical protein U0271_45530 [Polyangiaceae bacterium]
MKIRALLLSTSLSILAACGRSDHRSAPSPTSEETSTRTEASALPFDLKILPEDVLLFSKAAAESSPHGVKYTEQPKEAFVSRWAAMMCAADDVFRDFVEAGGEESERIIGEDVAARKELAKKLECGQKFAEKVPVNPAQYLIVFGADRSAKSVRIVLNDLEEYPSGDWVKKAKDKGEHITQAYCFTAKPKYEADKRGSDKDKPRECEWVSDKAKGVRADRGVARVEGTNMWLFGSLDSIKAFGDAFAPDGKHIDKSLDGFSVLLGKVKGHELVSMGTQESAGGLDLILDGVGDSKKPKDDTEVELRKLGDKAKSIDYQWAQGVTSTSSSTKTDYYLKCKSESDAKDMKVILGEIWTLSKVAAKELEEREKDQALPDSQYDKARVKANVGRVKALRAAMKKDSTQIRQEGVWVTLSLTTEIDATDQEDFGKLMKARWEPAAKATASLLKGEKPDNEVLKALGGSDLVDAVAATAKD